METVLLVSESRCSKTGAMLVSKLTWQTENMCSWMKTSCKLKFRKTQLKIELFLEISRPNQTAYLWQPSVQQCCSWRKHKPAKRIKWHWNGAVAALKTQVSDKPQFTGCTSSFTVYQREQIKMQCHHVLTLTQQNSYLKCKREKS